MISHKYKAVFIHIPKTGGETISSLFDDFDVNVPKHANANQLRAYLGEELWNEYYKFTFIRNPWDQVVSMYFHLRKSKTDPLNMKKKYGSTILNPVNACNFACSNSFESYCEEIFGKKMAQEEAMRLDWPIHHFSPSVEWICDDQGKLMVDDVFRFEKLNQEVQVLLKKVGLENCEVSRKNPSKHKHYSYYYNTKARKIVENHYLKDIVRFLYRFERKGGFLGSLFKSNRG